MGKPACFGWEAVSLHKCTCSEHSLQDGDGGDDYPYEAHELDQIVKIKLASLSSI